MAEKESAAQRVARQLEKDRRKDILTAHRERWFSKADLTAVNIKKTNNPKAPDPPGVMRLVSVCLFSPLASICVI